MHILSTTRIAFLLAASVGVVQAQTLDLSKPPLFLNGAVDPNLMVTFDDSGSMAFAFTPDAVGNGCAWRKLNYYASNHNRQYYNPSITYTPPLNAAGASLGDQSFTAAKTDGFNASSGTVNLETDFYASYDERSARTSKISYDAAATASAGCTAPPNRDNPAKFAFPVGSATAFYCVLNTGALDPGLDSSYACQRPTSAEQTNFANWFSYYRLRGHALKSAVSRSFGVLGDDVRVAWQNMSASQITSDTAMSSFASSTRTNFFNWLFASPYDGSTPTLNATMRAGDYFTRSGASVQNPYWDASRNRELMCRQNFHVLVTDGFWNENPHPTSSASKAAITGKTLPDGKTFSTGDAQSKFIWNEATRQADDCVVRTDRGRVVETRACEPSYADLAFHYWSTDLRTDLDDKVPMYFPNRTTGVTGTATDISTVGDLRSVPEIYWNPENDPANWQHVVQFFIGFGVSGALDYSPATYTSLRKGTTQWPAPESNQPTAVDDSWHGALASRGAYFGASDPNQIVDALSDILAGVVQRKGTSTAVAVSTGIIRSGTLAYQTQFDSTDWSGSVIARSVDTNQNFGAAIWDAGCMITGGDCATTGQTSIAAPNWNTGRQILTSNAASGSAGAAFRSGSLSSAQLASLNDNPSTVAIDNDGKASERIDYLRGDRSRERSRGGAFRNRSSLFGAVVHSSATVLGPPSKAEYDDTRWPAGSAEADATIKYKDFAETNKNRESTVFVGANDGMLHALNAQTGAERFAYVPHGVYPQLGKLTDPMYQFDPTVDNAVVVRDVFTNGAWRTLLVGSLRRGGQSIFALDVTSPTVLESNAGSVVRWQFSDVSTGGSDLGYTYGQPFITRLNNGKWVVLVPGSYNSTAADAAVGTGNAVLFVLDAATGENLRKFDVGAIDANARGLAAPVAIDYEQDDIAEIAYAGDLAGNLWRFDLTGNRPSDWTASKFFAPTTPFERPITAQPRAERHPDTKQTMIFVGTGKYIERADRTTNIPAQAFYGLIDDGSLVAQANLATRTVVSSGTLRRVSSASAPSSGAEKGWQIVFNEDASKGERVIAPASLRIVGRRVIFTTLIPSGDDPCLPGGTSYLMFADFATGGTAFDNYAFFDTNGDGEITSADDATAVGKKINTLVPGIASIMPPGGGIGGIVVPPSDGEGTPTVVKTREFEWRRRSFRDRTDLQGD